MIAAEQWRAYNEAVDGLCESARSEVSGAVSAWLAEHPDATVAEAREEAKRIMSGAVQRSDKAAASLAAQWYDSQARDAGVGLDRAVTEVVYTAADVDKLARYQAGRLVDGDLDGFARACGDFAVDNAKRSLNATILANVRRDRGKGVRFARVTSGRNTCAFCLMLAGRGAVYWSRKTAGAFNHWHTHCSCKVVPSYSGNAYDVLVEGHDPRKIENRLKEVERLTGTQRGTREFTREVALRDPDWLFGEEVATDYSINPIGRYGRLVVSGDYSPENIVDRNNEWRDLWVHHVLERNGIRAQVHGSSDIDLTINGEWWEVKSPDAIDRPPKPGRELAFIEKNLRKASHQFSARGMNGQARVVLNLKYRDMALNDGILAEVENRMRGHGIVEVLVIDRDGRVAHLR